MAAQLEAHVPSQQTAIRYECPHCGNSIYTMLLPLSGARSDGNESWWAASCTVGSCKLPALIKVVHQKGWAYQQLLQHNEIGRLEVQIIPAAVPRYGPVGVPAEVIADMKEALGCEAAGFYVAAAVVGRRALQRAVRERLGALSVTPKDNRLMTEIDALPDTTLPEQFKETAHEVRHLGNDGAHPEPVSGEEANVLLNFTKDVLHQLYTVPAQLAAAKAARAAKRGTDA